MRETLIRWVTDDGLHREQDIGCLVCFGCDEALYDGYPAVPEDLDDGTGELLIQGYIGADGYAETPVWLCGACLAEDL
jgi:hypothetical protein